MVKKGLVICTCPQGRNSSSVSSSINQLVTRLLIPLPLTATLPILPTSVVPHIHSRPPTSRADILLQTWSCLLPPHRIPGALGAHCTGLAQCCHTGLTGLAVTPPLGTQDLWQKPCLSVPKLRAQSSAHKAHRGGQYGQCPFLLPTRPAGQVHGTLQADFYKGDPTPSGRPQDLFLRKSCRPPPFQK